MGFGASFLGPCYVRLLDSNGAGGKREAQRRSRRKSERTRFLVKAFTPICVAKFQAASNASVKLDELKKISTAWARESFVREGKWAEIGNEQNTPVIDACATALYKL